jgi:hypothetical protein
MSETSTDPSGSAKRAVIELLQSRGKKARFITEVRVALERGGHGVEEIEKALSELEAEGIVMIRDNFCADPHLVGVDLRIVALIESTEGADPQLSAIREIDKAWDKWLGEYLANHRCG